MALRRAITHAKPLAHAPGSDWTRWQQPNPRSYYGVCCDCLLVHEMQFRTVTQSQNRQAGGAVPVSAGEWVHRGVAAQLSAGDKVKER